MRLPCHLNKSNEPPPPTSRRGCSSSTGTRHVRADLLHVRVDEQRQASESCGQHAGPLRERVSLAFAASKGKRARAATTGEPASRAYVRLGGGGGWHAPEIILEVVQAVLAVLDVGDDDVTTRNRVGELQGALGRDFLVAKTLPGLGVRG